MIIIVLVYNSEEIDVSSLTKGHFLSLKKKNKKNLNESRESPPVSLDAFSHQGKLILEGRCVSPCL